MYHEPAAESSKIFCVASLSAKNVPRIKLDETYRLVVAVFEICSKQSTTFLYGPRGLKVLSD
jgi:hypothetical protein